MRPSATQRGVIVRVTPIIAFCERLCRSNCPSDGNGFGSCSVLSQLMGRYSINDNTEQDPNPFPSLGQFDLHSRSQNAMIGVTRTITPRWVADGRISYYRSIFL